MHAAVTTGPPWRALIDRCRDEDEKAWEEFLAVFQAFAQRRLRRHFPGFGASDRADLVSATLERLVVAIRAGQIRGATDAIVAAYMARAIRNRALDHISQRRPEAALVDDLNEGSHDGRGYQRLLVQQVTSIVNEWSPAERFLFVQRSHGVSSERVKQELEGSPYCVFIDVATVDTRYHRLRARIRSRLGC
jgi:DNA-directed RNA polymerase specialized sigma24 family protein